MSQKTSMASSNVVLALFVNGKGFGLAVMKNAVTVIEAYNVIIRTYPITNKKVMERIKEKVDYYRPTVVVLEAPKGYGSRKSKRVKELIQKIAAFSSKKGLGVYHYSRNDIRFVFSAFNAESKYEIASTICENIPSLKYKKPEKRKSFEAEGYTTPIFDAVSLGITHYYNVD